MYLLTTYLLPTYFLLTSYLLPTCFLLLPTYFQLTSYLLPTYFLAEQATYFLLTYSPCSTLLCLLTCFLLTCFQLTSWRCRPLPGTPCGVPVPRVLCCVCCAACTCAACAVPRMPTPMLASSRRGAWSGRASCATSTGGCARAARRTGRSRSCTRPPPSPNLARA